jgi:hypothetical protein
MHLPTFYEDKLFVTEQETPFLVPYSCSLSVALSFELIIGKLTILMQASKIVIFLFFP